MNEESKKIWKNYLSEYVKDNIITYSKYITKDLNSIDYTQKLKEKTEDPKIKNEKILESIPIAEIEIFLRKKKLEKLKKIEE